MAILKPEINVPLTLEGIKYADRAEGKFGPQLKLKGASNDVLYTPLDTANVLQAAGVLRPEGDEFRVVQAFDLTYTRRDKAPPTITVDGEPVSAAKPAPAAPHRQEAGPGLPAAPMRQTGSWESLEATYTRCLKTAYATVGKLKGATVSDITASAATLFIQATKQGLTVAVAPSPASFATVPPALEPEADDGLPF